MQPIRANTEDRRRVEYYFYTDAKSSSETFLFTIHSPRTNGPKYRAEITRQFRKCEMITQIETFLSVAFAISSKKRVQLSREERVSFSLSRSLDRYFATVFLIPPRTQRSPSRTYVRIYLDR